MFDDSKLTSIRKDYPILQREIEGHPIVYLDNAATSQAPMCVVKAIEDMYFHHRANVHRGVHTLSGEATDMVEATREKVRAFINAASVEEVVFTRGTTEAINLVAATYGDRLCNGDEIILTTMEHHSNIVPWQLIGKDKRIRIRVVPINDAGEVNLDEYADLFTEQTRFVALAHVSNVLGTINPVKEMIAIAHQHGVPVLIDGAQAAPHIAIDVRDLDCDFYAFSAHKMYGPTGVGVLYGKKFRLNSMSPYQGGGEMIGTVSFERTDNIAAHERALVEEATRGLLTIDGMRIFGTAENKAGVISFLVGDINSYDMGLLLDKLGFEVRTGHHCAQPLMNRYGVQGMVRASFAAYNTLDEVHRFVEAVRRVSTMF